MSDTIGHCHCGAALFANHPPCCDTCGEYIPPGTMKRITRDHAERPQAPKPLTDHPDNEPDWVDNYPPRIKDKGDENE